MKDQTHQHDQPEVCQCDICRSQDAESKECSHLTGRNPEESSLDRNGVKSYRFKSSAGFAGFQTAFS
jgi:hypothetical protein